MGVKEHGRAGWSTFFVGIFFEKPEEDAVLSRLTFGLSFTMLPLPKRVGQIGATRQEGTGKSECGS